MPSTPPEISSITFDKPSYLPGETATATINYTPGMSDTTLTFNPVVTDGSNGMTGTLSASLVIAAPDPTSLTGATDTGNHAWTVVSDSGGVAVVTTKA